MGYKGLSFITGVAGIAVLSLVSGCQTNKSPARVAVAELSPTQGNNVRGVVRFTETARGIKVTADLTGLTPGKHGFHVHDKGDCSAPDATSAGAHFNPTGAAHGGPEQADRHVGDLGNITADANGRARYERVEKHMTFDGAKSVIGRAVIVHANPDDLTSQPAGNAGARVACGVIQLR